MTSSDCWLLVLALVAAVPVVYLIDCALRPVTRRVRRWWRGRNLR